MDRLNPLDALFIDAEDQDPHTSMAIALIAVFEGPAPSQEAFRAHLAGRLPLVPRYRQKLRSVPSMLIERIASPEAAPLTRNARCTTTSAWRNASCKAPGSRTSPRRYDIFAQPCAAGSKGRRAIPTTCATRSSASSKGTRPNPKVPVGPVTATVRSLLPPGAKACYLGPWASAVMDPPCQTHGIGRAPASRSGPGDTPPSGRQRAEGPSSQDD